MTASPSPSCSRSDAADPFPALSGCRRILVVDDEENIRHMLAVLLRRHGYDVHVSEQAEQALQFLRSRVIDLVLSDIRMPGLDGLQLADALLKRPDPPGLVLMSAFGAHEQAIEAIRRGADDYIAKPFHNEDLLFVLRKVAERRLLRSENLALRAIAAGHATEGDLIARSEAMRGILRMLDKVARHDATVLLSGESGTGKERLARSLHARSHRCDGPFVAINCSAIPETLLESELFGHVRGAFTGADRERQGLFESAAGGTLLLDEIHELPLPLQPKLLRVLQEGEIRRLGDTRTRPIDVRIVAAGSRPLDQLVDEGSFRDDLYYRLNVIALHIPPLRERRDDIPPLIDRFLARARLRFERPIEGFSSEAMRRLLAWSWPGNVRELENVVERAILLAESGHLDVDTLPDPVQAGPATPSGVHAPLPDTLSIKEATRALEKHLIASALRRTGGNRTQASRLLDLSHRALLYKIRDYFPDGAPE
ncbi:MAG: sigma-54-dependent Fis family transcriptional regulator [Deltaproteobacteria bacterium]|nr:MAG: sigma-54-dependent Fis family transcriptional regulator [Deltaproteobacteria bacterium]